MVGGVGMLMTQGLSCGWLWGRRSESWITGGWRSVPSFQWLWEQVRTWQTQCMNEGWIGVSQPDFSHPYLCVGPVFFPKPVLGCLLLWFATVRSDVGGFMCDSSCNKLEFEFIWTFTLLPIWINWPFSVCVEILLWSGFGFSRTFFIPSFFPHCNVWAYFIRSVTRLIFLSLG